MTLQPLMVNQLIVIHKPTCVKNTLYGVSPGNKSPTQQIQDKVGGKSISFSYKDGFSLNFRSIEQLNYNTLKISHLGSRSGLSRQMYG